MATTQLTAQPNSSAASALRPLIFDLGVPVGSYYLLRKLGVDLVPSLALSSVVPAVRAIVGLVRDRTFNGLATLDRGRERRKHRRELLDWRPPHHAG